MTLQALNLITNQNNSKHSEQGTRNDMQVRRIRQRSKTVKIGKLFVIAKPWITDFIFEDAQLKQITLSLLKHKCFTEVSGKSALNF